MGQREDIIAREEMLKKIRQALLVNKEHPFENEVPSSDENESVYVKWEDPNELVFAQNFMEAGGSFVFCESTADCIAQFQALSEQKNWNRMRIGSNAVGQFLSLSQESIIAPELCTGEEVGVTECEFLAARTGSIILSTKVCPDRLAWSYCSVHVVVAFVSQVIESLTDGYNRIREKYKDDYPSLVSVVTGPSRTADIEKQIVMGAHGPSEVYVFLIDNQS